MTLREKSPPPPFTDDGNGSTREVIERTINFESPCELSSCANDNSRENGKMPSNDVCRRDLRLMMLACEARAPYGPAKSTANLFLELICAAAIAHSRRRNEQLGGCRTKNDQTIQPNNNNLRVSITIYDAQLYDYPRSETEWERYDGVLIPGSLSSAYGTEEWIEALKDVIQREVHGRRRKSMAVCFGHQVFAHSFGGIVRTGHLEENFAGGMKGDEPDFLGAATDGGGKGSDISDRPRRQGSAVACPFGTQFGRTSFRTTSVGASLLRLDKTPKTVGDEAPHEEDDAIIDLLYTHTDMVDSLPPCAISLGGTDSVPIEAVAYFGTEDEARAYRNAVDMHHKERGEAVDGLIQPYALTFQGHPEYSTTSGFGWTFMNVLDFLDESGMVSRREVELAKESAACSYDLIETNSVRIMIGVALTLGWIA